MISGMESIRDQCTGTSRVRTILRVRNAIDLMIYTRYGLLGILFIKPSFYIILYKYFLQGMLHYSILFQNNWIQHITDTKTIRDTTLPAVETAKVGGDMTHNERNLI